MNIYFQYIYVITSLSLFRVRGWIVHEPYRLLPGSLGSLGSITAGKSACSFLRATPRECWVKFPPLKRSQEVFYSKNKPHCKNVKYNPFLMKLILYMTNPLIKLMTMGSFWQMSLLIGQKYVDTLWKIHFKLMQWSCILYHWMIRPLSYL